MNSRKKKKIDSLNKRIHEEKMISSRDVRVNAWRSFMNQDDSLENDRRKRKKITSNGFRPPQLKVADEEKTYIQRAIKK
jgi:hypothetical protein